MTGDRSRREFLRQLPGLAVSTTLATSARAKDKTSGTDAALDEIAKRLAAEGSGSIALPGSREHRRITYYNARFDCHRATVYLRPKSESGLRTILAWANTQRRTLAVRGGGHSFEGKSFHPELVIDMSAMDDLRFSREHGELIVGPGVTLGEAYGKLAGEGHIIPAGTCPTIGLVGHALGGGIGDFLPMFGYAAQAVRRVRLVTFSGAIIEVDDVGFTEREGLDGLRASELMKVLRGGGQGTLGVVTSMTFRTHDLNSTDLESFQLGGGDGLSAERAAKLIRAWQDWRMSTPEPIKRLVSSKLNFGRSGNSYSIDISGLVAAPRGGKIGIGEIKRDIHERLPQMKARFTKLRSVADAIKTFIDDDETTSNSKRKILYGSSSLLPRAMPLPALDHFVQQVPSGVYVSLYTAGGMTTQGPATSLHPSEFLIEWVAWTSRANADLYRRVRKVNDDTMKKAGFPSIGFPNYPDHELAGLPRRSYFNNAEQIARLRGLFDPNGISTSSLLSDQPDRMISCR